jgi:hypothetical protein
LLRGQALAINRSNFLDHLTLDVWLRLRAFSHQRALWHNARLQMFLDLFANFGWAPDASTPKHAKLYEPVVALTAQKRVFNPAVVRITDACAHCPQQYSTPVRACGMQLRSVVVVVDACRC